MPDGRPGDHPLTDITVHGMEIFGPVTDGAIRRLVNGAPPMILETLNDLIWYWPRVEPRSLWSGVVNPQDFRSVILNLEERWQKASGGTR